MFMKDGDLDEEGVLRRSPPPKPPDEIWFKKHEMMEMASNMKKKNIPSMMKPLILQL